MIPSKHRRKQLDFTNTPGVRRAARMVALGILGGACVFAIGAASQVTGAPTPDPATDHGLYTPFVWVAAGLVLAATAVGTRMHALQGTLEERTRKTFMSHVITLALSEAAAFLGLILVFLTRSWDVVLPAALGFAGLVTSTIRSEMRFSALVEEKEALDR